MQLMTLLILLFAIAIGFATFVENDYGRSSAKSLIFSAWWFEAILGLLVFNLINNLIKFKLFRLEKIAALTFHLSFILILIGAAITRYISYEGMMHIREGDSTNLFISDDTFLQVHIDDRSHQYKYDKKIFLSAITKNTFDINVNFKDNDISIKSVEFLPHVKDSLFVGVEQGGTILHLVVPGDNGMQDEFLNDGVQKMIKGEYFTLNNPKSGAINIFSEDNIIKCSSPYIVSTMSMLNRDVAEYDSLNNFILNRKTLHTANGLNFVFKDIFFFFFSQENKYHS